MNIIKPTPEHAQKVCKEITANLPEWFAHESSNQQYFKDCLKYKSLVITKDNKDIGLLVYKQTDKKTLDIHWLGILKEYHRSGLGGNFINRLIDETKELNITRLTLETVDPAQKNEAYLKTIAFYEKFGFSIYEYFNYDGFGMVKMQKII